MKTFKLSLIGFFLLIPLFAFGQTCDNETIYYSYTDENDQEQVGTTSGGGSVKHAIYFPATSTHQWFGKAVMKLANYGSPSDDLILDFKGGETTSTLTSLASTTINNSALVGFPSFTTYSWILDDDIPLNATTSYWLELYRSGALNDSNNYVFRDKSSGGTGEAQLYRYATNWAELSGRDGYVIMSYCDTHEEATSTGSGILYPIMSTSTDALIGNFFHIAIYILIIGIVLVVAWVIKKMIAP